MAYKLIALIGEAGSGKDTILRQVHSANNKIFNKVVNYTTRPKRDNEVEGINYYFITPEIFAQKIIDGEMMEATCFNDWFYGTGINVLKQDKINIGVFNPEGIESILNYEEIDLKIFYIKASDKERLIRQLNREYTPNIDEIIRRYYADKNDFSNLAFPHFVVSNESLSEQEAVIFRILECANLWWQEDKIN